jgi:single-strand DNA-binding protein
MAKGINRVHLIGNVGQDIELRRTKGSTCFVEGRLQTRSWEDQQGNKRSKTEVVAKNVQFLDKRESAPQQDAYNNNYESQQSSDNPYGGSYNTGGNPYA